MDTDDIPSTNSALDAPIFLVGSERSGTTMLRLMLNSHPEISFGGQFEYAFEYVGDDGSYPDLEWLEHELSLSRIFIANGQSVDTSLTYEAQVRAWLVERAGDAQIVGAPVHFGYQGIHFLYPQARYIHIVRDPRDVSPSCIQMGWAGTVWHGLDKWLEAELGWSEFAPTIPAEQRFEITFEELVSDHVGSLTALCNYIGVDYTDDMMSYTTSSDYSIPDPSAAQRWKLKASDEDIQLMEARLGSLLTDAGYEPSGLPLLQPEDIDHDMLLREHLRKKRKMRVDRYGLPLTVAGVLTKPKALAPIREKVIHRMIEVDDSLLRKTG